MTKYAKVAKNSAKSSPSVILFLQKHWYLLSALTLFICFAFVEGLGMGSYTLFWILTGWKLKEFHLQKSSRNLEMHKPHTKQT